MDDVPILYVSCYCLFFATALLFLLLLPLGRLWILTKRLVVELDS